MPDGEEKKQSRMTKQSFEGLTCLTLSTVGGGWGAGFGMIFRGVIGGLTRLDIDKGLEGWLVSKQSFHVGKPLHTRYTSCMEAVTRAMMGAMKPMASQE